MIKIYLGFLFKCVSIHIFNQCKRDTPAKSCLEQMKTNTIVPNENAAAEHPESRNDPVEEELMRKNFFLRFIKLVKNLRFCLNQLRFQKRSF